MSSIASASSPMPSADPRDGDSISDGRRAGPSGRGLFDAAADLLAAARALAANADAPDTSVALPPALACLEASLEALAEATERIGEEACAEGPEEWVSRPMAAANFDRLAGALRSATSACNDARRVAAASV